MDVSRRSSTPGAFHTGAEPAREGGFSLVEVLCALVILGVGLVGVTQGITLSLHSSKDAEHYTTAVLLAAGKLETIRTEGYLTSGEDDGEFGDAFPQLSWKQNVKETSLDGLYEVEVTIELRDSDRVVYELRTFLFDMPYQSLSSLDGTPTDEATTRNRGAPRRPRRGTR